MQNFTNLSNDLTIESLLSSIIKKTIFRRICRLTKNCQFSTCFCFSGFSYVTDRVKVKRSAKKRKKKVLPCLSKLDEQKCKENLCNLLFGNLESFSKNRFCISIVTKRGNFVKGNKSIQSIICK